MRSPTASRPIRPRAIIRWPTASRVEGIRLVFENLPKAFANGKDITARAHMMSAAAMGATAFQKGLGAIHSLSHPIGALYDTHHGMTNAVFMPYVLAFNRDAIEERIARLAAYLGIKGGFDGFAKAVLKLRKELKVPHTLPDLIKGLDMDKKRKGADRRHGGRRPDRRRQSGQADQEGGADAARQCASPEQSEPYVCQRSKARDRDARERGRTAN